MKRINKKANYKYKLFDKYETGVVLIGAEVKALKKGNIDLSQSFAKIVEDEVYLINASIPIIGKKDYQPTRTRKLLLHKDQITSIRSKIKAKKLTLVPVSMYTKGRLVKVEIALAKAKRKFEKKEAVRRRDIEREVERELRGEKDNKSRV